MVVCGARQLRNGLGTKRSNKIYTSEFRGQEGLCVAVTSVKYSTAHRPKIRQSSKPNKERKQPGILVPPDSSVSIGTEGTAVQLCGDGKVTEKWINGDRNGTNISGQIWMDSGKHCTFAGARMWTGVFDVQNDKNRSRKRHHLQRRNMKHTRTEKITRL